MLVALKHVISFKIKKQNIFDISLITKVFIFLINLACITFGVFRDEWLS